MIVVTLTDCPPRLRGDLTKWLVEINTGVYVGQLNQRVWEKLWQRICDNLPRGRATMVYSAANEQRMEFRVHNTTWEPVDFEGLTLMRRPNMTQAAEAAPPSAPSRAAVGQMTRKKQASRARSEKKRGYVVVDAVTTGPDPQKDELLELAALRVVDHAAAETFASWGEEGEMLPELLGRFWSFVGECPMVGYDMDALCAILSAACARTGLAMPILPCCDIRRLARRADAGLPDSSLETLASHFSLPVAQTDQAPARCETLFRLYEKLNEF